MIDVTPGANIEMNNLLETLLKEKTQDGKKPLQVQGLSFIHPMHEAIIAFFKKNLNDVYICSMFAKDEDSLRKTIALEILADKLEPKLREKILKEFETSADLNKTIDLIALAYSENKRMSNTGSVLQELIIPEGARGKYFVEAIRQEGSRGIYIESGKIPNIETRTKSIKKRRIAKRIGKAMGYTLLTATLGLTLYGAKKSNDESQELINSLQKKLDTSNSILERKPTQEIEYLKKYYESEYFKRPTKKL